MSFSSEYIEYKKKKKQREEQQKLLQKQLKQQKLPPKAATQKKDIGPVPKKEQGDWVSAGLFDDGYQFGDILRTIGGTALDLVGNVAGGALEIGEGVVDAAAYIVGGVGELFGAKDFAKDTKKFIANDLYSGEEVANRILSLGLVGEGGHDEASLLGEKLDSIAQSGGQLAGNLAITAATGGAVPWWLTTGVTSFGQATQEAFNEGADYAQAGASGLISAGAEILTEKLFGGSGLREKGLFNLDGLTKGISNKFVKAVLDLGVDMAAEGTEEFFSSVISKFGDAIVKEKNPFELITDEKAIEEYIDSFIGGAILGGIMNTGKVNKARAKKGGRDYRTGLTATEEKVFNKAYEAAISDRSKGGKELTKKEKAEIYDGVMDDLRKGRVSTGAIEEILGGESYKAYKDAVDKDNATIKELQGLYEGKELEQKIKDILDNSGRNELKKKLSDEVFGLAKEEGSKMKDRGSFLAESYYEQERGSQKFEADLSQYDEKHRKTVQKAIDSGILNNKRSTHEMVDLFAKLSADKGVEIDFTDNEKIKGTSFAVEGKTVNGYVDKDGNITVNIESPKYLNSIVGHEITHILEGTDLYEALQKEITALALSKGEYKDRLRTAMALYKNVDGYKGADGFKKIKREVVADLVGDYLFTDADFVRNLHTNNRNLFQKIYDEIKYLCKIATAGSKEARQLESVKRAFERAYQDGSKATGEVKHSLSTEADKNYLDAVNRGDTEAAQKMVDEAAKAAGYTVKVYHGTKAFGFTKVKTRGVEQGVDWSPFFAANKEDISASYVPYGKVRDISSSMDNDAIEEARESAIEDRKENISNLVDEFRRLIDRHFSPWVFGQTDNSYLEELVEKANPVAGEGDGVYDVLSDIVYDAFYDYQDNFAEYEDADEWAENSPEAKDIFDKIVEIEGEKSAIHDIESGEELGGIYELYANLDNMYVVDGKGAAWNELRPEGLPKLDRYGIKDVPYKTRDVAKWAMENGFDGVIFKNIRDNGAYGRTPAGDVYAFFNPESQVKSADLVTYDDNGNVIPLSERFNAKKDDIRYSLTDIDGKPIDSARISTNESDVTYSLSHNAEIAKGQSDYILNKRAYVSAEELEEAQKVTNAMVDVMMKYSSILPEDKIGKVLTKNGSYDRSVENTTICVRTLAYNEFVDKVQEQIGRPLTQMESFLVSQKLYDIATEPQCLYCYVSLDRKAFNDMLLRYMTDRDTVIAKYNNSDKMPDTIAKLYEEFLNGRKDTKNMKERFDKWIGYVDNGTQLLSLADIATEDRQSTIKANGGILAEQLKDARAYAQSASWSKIQKNYVAYRDEILKLGDRVVKNLNEHYGMRWYSFSDYSAAFIVENMQQITDASIRGLKGLAYTKDTDFAEVFAPSGMNINVSVFVNQDENGNFYIDEKQSANFEKAMDLRERYPNVGIVATVTNDEALRWVGEQGWSDVIIPFHIVRTGMDVADYYKWLNYTSESADTVENKDLWESYLDSLNIKSENARKKVSKNIYPSEHKNNKETYLSLCESRGLTPRFVRFAGEPWYMKLVNETRLSSDESTPLKPIYNLDAAKASFQKFVDKGGYEGGWYKEGVNVDSEAAIVAEDVLAGKKANEVDYGRQDRYDPESILEKRKTIRGHGFSLSEEGTSPDPAKKYGNFNIRGEDVRYNPTTQEAADDIGRVNKSTTDIGPVREDVSPANEANVDIRPLPQYSVPASEPVSEAEASAYQRERLESLSDVDAPFEQDAGYYDLHETGQMPKTKVVEIAKRLRKTLGLSNRQMSVARGLVEEYSKNETLSRDELFGIIKERFGKHTFTHQSDVNDVDLDDKTLTEAADIIVNEIADYRQKWTQRLAERNAKHFPTDKDVPIAESEYNARVGSLYESLKDKPSGRYHKVDGYGFVVTRDTSGEGATITIRNRKGETVKERIEGGRYLTNNALWQKAAESVAKKEFPNVVSDAYFGDGDIGPVGAKQQEDRLSRSIKRIDRTLEHEKADLDEEFQIRRDDLQAEFGDKDSFVARRAMELYTELNKLKKGVRASEALGHLLDYGYPWQNIKTALLNANRNPARTVDQNSAMESIVREALNEEYENGMYEFDELENEYKRRLKELEKGAETKRKNAKTANQRRTKQNELFEKVKKIVGDTSTWVDKKLGLSYKTNTLRRNLRDVVRDENGNRDIQKADAIYEWLQGKYNQNEASLNRESNRIKKVFADMKITDAESVYIQMLGEFRHNPETTLTEERVKEFLEENKGSIDEAKVDKAIELARETYDGLLLRVNEVLRENGMKEIPYRKGYFPHFTEEKQGFLAKLFNWKTQNNDIPTDIAGITEQFNPNRSWQSFNKQRKGDTTDYNFLKGMDSYVFGALDWIYHIEDIQNRRALENYIRYTHSEEGVKAKIDAIRANDELDADEVQEQIDLVYATARNPLNNFVTDLRAGTNKLANKKSSLDRGMEEVVNRKVYSTMTNLSNRVSANMVAGSFSSALTNIIPITQSWAEVSPAYSVRVIPDIIKNAVHDDGVIEKSAFLTNRLRKAENLHKTTWDKIGDGLGWLMEGIDSFTAQVVWRSKYLQNIEKNGMSESQAIANADQFAENVIAGRSRGNMPTIFDSKNPLVKTLTAFQLEVNNQYGYMFKDMPQDIKNESVGKLVKGYATMFLGAYVFNALFSSLTGRDAAFDPVGIVEDLLRDLGLFGEDDEEEPTDALMGLTENIVQELPFVGGLLGGGRIPISSALPFDGDIMGMLEASGKAAESGNYQSLTKEWLKPLYYLAMPMGGGQLKKSIEGLSMFDNSLPVAGSYTDSGDLRFPVEDTLGNRIQAGLFGQWANANAREYFEGGHKPLSEKQTQEYLELGAPISDYWEYREKISSLDTISEKADYINSLSIPTEKKNLLINNISNRQNPIDMSNYDLFGNFEEFEMYNKNPELYSFLQGIGVSYEDYAAASNEEKEAYQWAANNQDQYTLSKAVTNDLVQYKNIVSSLNQIKADQDKNGKTISGSRKQKVLKYINSLGLSDGQRYILYKLQYPSDDTYDSKIISYIRNKKDFTREEQKYILEQLGYTLSNNGTVKKKW